MPDQITFSAAKRRIYEESQYAVSVRFRTRATGDATPTNIKYRLDCLTTGAEILALTSVAAANPVTITVTPAQNAIQSDRNDIERKQLMIIADEGLSTQFVERYTYEVVNLYGIV